MDYFPLTRLRNSTTYLLGLTNWPKKKKKKKPAALNSESLL